MLSFHSQDTGSCHAQVFVPSPSCTSAFDISEVLENIMRFMSRPSVLRLATVNSQWHRVALFTLGKHHMVHWDDSLSNQDELKIAALIKSGRVQHLKLDTRLMDQDHCRDHHHSHHHHQDFYGYDTKEKGRLCRQWPKILRTNTSRDRTMTVMGFRTLRESVLIGQGISSWNLVTILPELGHSLVRFELKSTGPFFLNLQHVMDGLPCLRDLCLGHWEWDGVHHRPRLTITPETTVLASWDEEYHYWAHKQTTNISVQQWLHSETSYPNLKVLELRSVEIQRQVMDALLSRSTNLQRVVLMDCSIDISQFPKLRELGLSNTRMIFSHEYLSSLTHRFPNIESLEMPGASFSEHTLLKMHRRWSKTLTSFDLTNVAFNPAMNKALNLFLYDSPGILRHLWAPNAVLTLEHLFVDLSDRDLDVDIEYRDRNLQWNSPVLQTLAIGFDLLGEWPELALAEANRIGLDPEDQEKASSGLVFAFLARHCPKLSYLRVRMTPQISWGPLGLGQLRRLECLENLWILLECMVDVTAKDLEWIRPPHWRDNLPVQWTGTKRENMSWPQLERFEVLVSGRVQEEEVLAEMMRELRPAVSFRMQLVS